MHWTTQIDDYLPTQFLLYIGALRVYAARLNFFLSVPNTLMIGVLFYRRSRASASGLDPEGEARHNI